MSLIGDINLQVYPLYDSLCPTFHHYNCPYNVSIYEGESLRTPLKDTIIHYFRWRLKQLKSVHAHLFLHTIFIWKMYIVKKTLLTLSGRPLFSLFIYLNMVITIASVGKSGKFITPILWTIYHIFIIVNMYKSGQGDYPPSDAPLTFWQNQVF